MVFTIPFRLGIEIVPWVEWLEKKGCMNWTKVFNVDTQKVIQKIHNNDDFELMNNRITVGFTIPLKISEKNSGRSEI
jgi:hypothetical protein